MLFRSTIAVATGAALFSFAAATQAPVCKVVTYTEYAEPTWVPDKHPKVYPTKAGGYKAYPSKGNDDSYPTKGGDKPYPTKGGDDSYPTGGEKPYPTSATDKPYPTVSKDGWQHWNGTATTLSTSTYSATDAGSSYPTTTDYPTDGGYPTTTDYPTDGGYPTTTDYPTDGGYPTTTVDPTSTDGGQFPTSTTGTYSTTSATGTYTTTSATGTYTTTTTTGTYTTTTTTGTYTTTTTTGCPAPTQSFVLKAVNAADSSVNNKYAVVVQSSQDRQVLFSESSASSASIVSFTEDCQIVTPEGRAFLVTDQPGEFVSSHHQSVLNPGVETGSLDFVVQTCSTSAGPANALALACNADGQTVFQTDHGLLTLSQNAVSTYDALTVILEPVVTVVSPRRRR